MRRSEAEFAELTGDNEPSDGTKLVVQEGGNWRVILRDDRAAKTWDAAEGDHWFDGDDTGGNDPMSLHQHLKYADHVYTLGEPLARIRR